MMQFTRLLAAAVKAGVNKKVGKVPLPGGLKRPSRASAASFSESVQMPPKSKVKGIAPPKDEVLGKGKTAMSLKGKDTSKPDQRFPSAPAKDVSTKSLGKSKRAAPTTKGDGESLTAAERIANRRSRDNAPAASSRSKKTIKQIHRKVVQKSKSSKSRKNLA
uniref:Uncharacterized protein TCIL3000_10_7750 n=1 Tax=Trypanosoma congolense (strain IL3000) TaxID=1068625 RepID=G0UX84_TRYCI|nr:unnamed protein product [Trypanosoma congolense IL3000]CCC94001.1 conserved hypothetical protein [Trypanosoma congolense IL3000]